MLAEAALTYQNRPFIFLNNSTSKQSRFTFYTTKLSINADIYFPGNLLCGISLHTWYIHCLFNEQNEVLHSLKWLDKRDILISMHFTFTFQTNFHDRDFQRAIKILNCLRR